MVGPQRGCRDGGSDGRGERRGDRGGLPALGHIDDDPVPSEQPRHGRGDGTGGYVVDRPEVALSHGLLA